MMGLGRRDSFGLRMTSFGTGIPTCCLIPSATVPAHDLRHMHQKVPLWIGPVQRRSSHFADEGDPFVTGAVTVSPEFSVTVGG